MAVGVNQTRDVHKLDMRESRIGLSSSVFQGSDSARTRKFLTHLEKQGQPGRIAAALFRSQKASSKAKLYSGGIERSNGEFHSYRSLSYQKKSRSLKELCSLLLVDSAGIVWGWGRDDANPHAPRVLYLELPTGQVRFHSAERLAGPDYPGNLDGERPRRLGLSPIAISSPRGSCYRQSDLARSENLIPMPNVIPTNGRTEQFHPFLEQPRSRGTQPRSLAFPVLLRGREESAAAEEQERDPEVQILDDPSLGIASGCGLLGGFIRHFDTCRLASSPSVVTGSVIS